MGTHNKGQTTVYFVLGVESVVYPQFCFEKNKSNKL